MVITLTKTQKKVLSCLDKNARQTDTQIAKELKTSKQVVAYTIKQLEEIKVLRAYTTIINSTALNQTPTRLLWNFKNYEKNLSQRIVAWVHQQKNIDWLGFGSGLWEAGLVIQGMNQIEVNDIIQKFLNEFSNNIASYDVTPAVVTSRLSHQSIHDDKSKYIFTTATNTSSIDATDKKILQALQNNARRSIISIADQTQVTTKTVAHRIKQLEQNNLILGYTVELQYNTLGLDYYHVYLILKKHDQQHKRKLLRQLEQLSECVYTVQSYGLYELEAEFVTKNLTELHMLLSTLRDKNSDIIIGYKLDLIHTVIDL